MFTGLIQGMGRVQAADHRSKETRFTIAPLSGLADFVKGESIAVNGACLTVETFSDSWFTAFASGETLSRTSLGGLRTGDTVNLERALALGDRLGGHLVSGHVDCLATVASATPDSQSLRFRIAFPPEFGTQVVPKGSVALDGISLTVNHCGPDFLEVNIIPATQSETTIAAWRPGRIVNMETDLIGKYVLRMLGPWRGDAPAAPERAGIDEDFLRRHGF